MNLCRHDQIKLEHNLLTLLVGLYEVFLKNYQINYLRYFKDSIKYLIEKDLFIFILTLIVRTQKR